MEKKLTCPQCATTVVQYRNPFPTVDVVIYDPHAIARGIVLIERANPPHGFALPGGFIDYGESAEQAAVREMYEETSLEVELIGLLGVYSIPQRDPRSHTLSVVYVGIAKNTDALCAGDDAKNAAFYPLDSLPSLAFDHAKIVEDFSRFLQKEHTLAPISYPLTLKMP